LEFLFKSKTPGEKARLLSAFEAFARENHLPKASLRAADLAIEEHLTNILSYGFADSAEHIIAVNFQILGGELVIEIIDDGRAFNPTTYPKPNLNIPAEQREIGGLGIHMILQSMDSVSYERSNNRNLLRMRKQSGS
jgi:anti-sigma regulatory factor (Ser/Thr protein kinase)